MLQSVTFIKALHSALFLFLAACLAYVLYSAAVDQITIASWIAYGCLLLEGIILLFNDWRCPLTTYVERLGEEKGSVTDIFLPKWLADRAFFFLGGLAVLATLLLIYRTLT